MRKKILQVRVIILCNSGVAEPQYFQSLKDYLKIAKRVKIISKSSCSDAPWRLIERAIEIKKENDEDEIWCVFDIDRYLSDNASKMKSSVKCAVKAGIFLAWSNICFELWLLLHFIPFDSEYGCCGDYAEKIKKECAKLKIKYQKNSDIFMYILPLQQQAIKNAKRICSDKMEANPSTQIFKLVERLNGLE